MKKRSERKAAFTRCAIAGASEASAVRICEEVGNGWILLEGQRLWNGGGSPAHRRSPAPPGLDSRGGRPYPSLDGPSARRSTSLILKNVNTVTYNFMERHAEHI